MSNLSIYAADNANDTLFASNNANEIQLKLAEYGVAFAQWPTHADLQAGGEPAEILERYQLQIRDVQTNGGYQTVDVIALAKGNPNAAALRQKFLFEHTHSEDEVRFFVQGQGLFCLHLQNHVLQVLCQQGDLINVPANTKHWFDMGSDPEFTAIRFFNNEAGWVAQATSSDIATRFPLLA